MLEVNPALNANIACWRAMAEQRDVKFLWILSLFWLVFRNFTKQNVVTDKEAKSTISLHYGTEYDVTLLLGKAREKAGGGGGEAVREALVKSCCRRRLCCLSCFVRGFALKVRTGNNWIRTASLSKKPISRERLVSPSVVTESKAAAIWRA